MTIKDSETYTKSEICEFYGISDATLNMWLRRLEIVAVPANSQLATISGKLWNERIYREQIRCQAEERRNVELDE